MPTQRDPYHAARMAVRRLAETGRGGQAEPDALREALACLRLQRSLEADETASRFKADEG